MAIVCNISPGARLERLTGIMDIRSTYTVMGWFLFTTAPTGGATNACAIFRGTGTDPLDAMGISDVAGVTRTWLITNGPSNLYEQYFAGSALSTNTWYHFAMVRASGTQLIGYLNGVQDTILNHTDNASTYGASTSERFGGDTWLGRVAGYKGWQRALTANEILQEMDTIPPVGLGPWTWSPAFPGTGERTRDYSGNGRDWSENGTVTDGDPPPISYGAPVLWVNNPAAAVQLPYSWVPDLGPLLAQ